MGLSAGRRFDMRASASSSAAYGNQHQGFGCEEEEALWERWGRPGSASCDAVTQVALRPCGGWCVCVSGLRSGYSFCAYKYTWMENTVEEMWTRGAAGCLGCQKGIITLLVCRKNRWVIFNTSVCAGTAPPCPHITWSLCRLRRYRRWKPCFGDSHILVSGITRFTVG